MTLREEIEIINRLKPNTLNEAEIIRWISEVDNTVKTEIIDSHEGEHVVFAGYDGSTDKETVLLIPDAYCDSYLYYVSAKIDMTYGDWARYNNNLSAFHSVYDAFAAEHIRTHMPKSASVVF